MATARTTKIGLWDTLEMLFGLLLIGWIVGCMLLMVVDPVLGRFLIGLPFDIAIYLLEQFRLWNRGL